MVLDNQISREADTHVLSALHEQRTVADPTRLNASQAAGESGVTGIRRSQLRRLVVLVTTPAVTLGSLTLASAFVLGAFDHHATAAAGACRAPAQVDLASFTVSVLNGSGIPGQARSAAEQLTRAGFRVDEVTTASDSRWTDAPAVINYGAQGRESARRLAAHLPGAVQVPTQAFGRDLEVVLGTAFTGASLTPNLQELRACD